MIICYPVMLALVIWKLLLRSKTINIKYLYVLGGDWKVK